MSEYFAESVGKDFQSFERIRCFIHIFMDNNQSVPLYR